VTNASPAPPPGADSRLEPLLYGLDIETDTSTGGLDPHESRVLAAAIASPRGTQVITGPEPKLLAQLDSAFASLAPGVIVTWNGGGFDLPFLAARAERAALPIGLRVWPDGRVVGRPLQPGGAVAYSAAWHHHGHLDAYRLYRHVRLALGVSASLKSLARHLGLPAIEPDASRVHELSPADLAAYVARDAELAVEMAHRAWSRSGIALDPAPPAPPAAMGGGQSG